MSGIETIAGVVVFELGHQTDQYDINFVIFTSSKPGSGFNCRMRTVDLLKTDAREYLLSGGICAVIARGRVIRSPIMDKGWTKNTNIYMQVDWLQMKRDSSFLDEIFGVVNQHDELMDDGEDIEFSSNEEGSQDGKSQADQEVKPTEEASAGHKRAALSDGTANKRTKLRHNTV